MATEPLLAIHRAIVEAFPGIHPPGNGVGVKVDRNIANTSEKSQHAYGNAQDYKSDPATMERLYQWLIARRGILPIGTVCYNHRGGCTTAHTDHVHVDALPRLTGPTSNPSPRKAAARPPERQGGITSWMSVDGDGFNPDYLGGDDPTVYGLIESANPLDALTAVPALITTILDPSTWIRAGMFIGGGALVIMGLAAIIGGPVVAGAAMLPGAGGAVGKIAAAGQSIGGK